MNKDQKIRDLTSKMIQVLVWFELLWATVFFVGAIFRFSGLTDQLATAFFGSGFCAVIVLVSTVLLNVTANLNIISKAQVASGKLDEEPSSPLAFSKIIGVAAGLIGLIVVSLGFAEWRLYQKKVADVKVKLEAVVETGLVNEATKLIMLDGKVRELDRIREALSANIQSGSRLSLIFPLKVKDVEIYYELHAWWYYNKDITNISGADLPKFVPTGNEKNKWEKLLKGDLGFFASADGDNIRAFRKIKTENGPIILLIDTSRRSDYERSWGKS